MQAIHGIQPPSKLQAIVNNGLKRMDDAVEAVIAKHCQDGDARRYIESVTDGMRLMNEQLKPLVDKMVQGNIDPNTGIPRYHKSQTQDTIDEKVAIRARNYETALRNEMNSIFGKGFM